MTMRDLLDFGRLTLVEETYERASRVWSASALRIDEASKIPPVPTRYDVAREIDIALAEPFGEEERRAYQEEDWARRNVEAMGGRGAAGDPHMAQPVNR